MSSPKELPGMGETQHLPFSKLDVLHILPAYLPGWHRLTSVHRKQETSYAFEQYANGGKWRLDIAPTKGVVMLTRLEFINNKERDMHRKRMIMLRIVSGVAINKKRGTISFTSSQEGMYTIASEGNTHTYSSWDEEASVAIDLRNRDDTATQPA